MKTKVSFYILLALISLTSCDSCSTSTSKENLPAVGAMVDFQEASCDLGFFASTDSIHIANIWFRNSGDMNLILSEAFTSCGCTVVSINGKEIEPGDSAVVKIRYSGHDKLPGRVSQGVVVFSNAINSPTRIAINGYMGSGDADIDTVSGYEKHSLPVIRKKNIQN